MKISKFLAIALAAVLLAAPCRAQSSTTAATESTLTTSNGLAAGKALLSLYTQYKADGKFDLNNASNISNLVSLATNIQGLAQNTNVKSFLSGLISGSKNLVNSSNSSSVLSTLKSISGLDLNSLGTSAATSAASSLLSKLGGSSTSSSASSNSAAGTAANALTKLFSTLGTQESK